MNAPVHEAMTPALMAVAAPVKIAEWVAGTIADEVLVEAVVGVGVNVVAGAEPTRDVVACIGVGKA